MHTRQKVQITLVIMPRIEFCILILRYSDMELMIRHTLQL